MGHQFARAIAATALTAALALAACGGDDDGAEPPPVLDNVRDLVASAADAAGAAADSGASDAVPTSIDAAEAAQAAVAELPSPDRSEFVGANRVVNLWVGVDGETHTVDVWGRRTFTNGPILLVEGLGFGEASDYFSAPPGYRLAIVGAGAGPDADELAGMFNAADGEQITVIYTNDDDQGSVWAPNLWEIDPSGSAGAPAPPLPGTGLVYLYAANTKAFQDALTPAIGGGSFYVGDGSAECRPQRIEERGFQPNVLGGTQDVQLDLPAGPATITLHPWFSPDECDQPSVLDVDVDVPADGAVLVVVYTPDGQSINALQLAIG